MRYQFSFLKSFLVLYSLIALLFCVCICVCICLCMCVCMCMCVCVNTIYVRFQYRMVEAPVPSTVVLSSSSLYALAIISSTSSSNLNSKRVEINSRLSKIYQIIKSNVFPTFGSKLETPWLKLDVDERISFGEGWSLLSQIDQGRGEVLSILGHFLAECRSVPPAPKVDASPKKLLPFVSLHPFNDHYLQHHCNSPKTSLLFLTSLANSQRSDKTLWKRLGEKCEVRLILSELSKANDKQEKKVASGDKAGAQVFKKCHYAITVSNYL